MHSDTVVNYRGFHFACAVPHRKIASCETPSSNHFEADFQAQSIHSTFSSHSSLSWARREWINYQIFEVTSTLKANLFIQQADSLTWWSSSIASPRHKLQVHASRLKERLSGPRSLQTQRIKREIKVAFYFSIKMTIQTCWMMLKIRGQSDLSCRKFYSLFSVHNEAATGEKKSIPARH